MKGGQAICSRFLEIFYAVVLLATKDSFIDFFISFSCLVTVVRTSNAVLSKSVRADIFALFCIFDPDLRCIQSFTIKYNA